MNIVIVESPAKAKTVNKYLGAGYRVFASYGHVRDLPSKNGSVLPDKDFEMHWDVEPKAAKRLDEIAKAVKGASKLILATDPDREGEAISWHVLQVLDRKKALAGVPVERVVFNAVTKEAVLDAMRHPRAIDGPLVSAYLARRALDYLVGFTLSPVLWRKLPGARSAGRVQSVALRLVCDRELEIEKFRAQEYWSILAELATAKNETFQARLVAADGKKLDKFDIPDAGDRRTPEGRAGRRPLQSREHRKQGAAPQPGRPLHHLDPAAGGIAQARLLAAPHHAARPAALRGRRDGRRGRRPHHLYANRRRADRAGSRLRRPPPRDQALRRSLRAGLAAPIRGQGQERAGSARGHQADRLQQGAGQGLPLSRGRRRPALQADLAAHAGEPSLERRDRAHHRRDRRHRQDGKPYGVRATGSVIRFDGFLKIYEEGIDDAVGDDGALPALATGDALDPRAIEAKQHFTEPPPRYSEATLIKKMEELGIGRPSTYASTLNVLRDREYVRIDKKRLYPEDKGRLVTAFLESFFSRYVEYDFTADLEEKLDLISAGELEWKDVLRDFWREFIGAVNDIGDLRITQVLDALNDLLGPHIFPDQGQGTDPRACPSCGIGRLSLKVGKFGAFIGCSNYPDCRFTRQLADTNGEKAALAEAKVLGADPETGLDVSLRTGRFGPYVQLGEQNGKEKPKRASIPKGTDPQSLELRQALALLALPREVGLHPESGKPIVAGFGRYGPYIQHDGKYASLGGPEEVFEVGLNRAVSLLAEKAASSRAPRGASVIKELGEHPALGGKVQILTGRYGPYVKHGKVNATIPKDREPEQVTMEEAVELIAARAAKGPVKKKPAKKPARKSAKGNKEAVEETAG